MPLVEITPWNDLLDDTPAERHLVHCYADDGSLIESVARFLGEGMRRGDGLLVIATPDHRRALLERVAGDGVDAGGVEESGRLMALDAQQTLERILVDGEPNAAAFDRALAPVVRRVRGMDRRRVRVYGEMVGQLWSAWRFAAAVRMEAYWNRLLAAEGVSLYCAYPIDVLGPEFDPALLHAVLCAHTHLVPSLAQLDPAVDRAVDQLLGPADGRSPPRYAGEARWAALPPAEARVLWIRANLPDDADRILARQPRPSAAPAA